MRLVQVSYINITALKLKGKTQEKRTKFEPLPHADLIHELQYSFQAEVDHHFVEVCSSLALHGRALLLPDVKLSRSTALWHSPAWLRSSLRPPR